jgi:enediyne biosynthesis protein E4
VFLNSGGTGFRDATEGSGLTGKRWGTSAALLDYDLDGSLDLVVVNYLSFRRDEISARDSGECKWKGLPVMCGPEGLTAVHDQLYRGNGDGTFSDVTAEAGFRPDDAGFGLGVTTLDYDGDGDTDVYVTNDSTPNFLWENQGDGTFVEVGFRRGVDLDSNGKEQAGMGIACGDVNEDGLPDLFVTNFSGENNALYQSRASKTGRAPRFSDRSHSAGVGGPSMQLLGWGTGMFDVELDGDLDLFVLNGHVYPQADSPGTDTTYAQPDQLFVNKGGGIFDEHPLAVGPDLVSRGGAFADLDGDGDIDVVATQVEGAIQIHENTTTNDNRWIAFALDVEGGNRDGLGARVEITVGERRSVTEIRTSSGFQAAVPARAHFGLGSAERVDSVSVRLPDGRTRRFENLVAGQVHRLALPALEPAANDSGATSGSEGGR